MKKFIIVSMAIAGLSACNAKSNTVVLETEAGNIHIQVLTKQAPISAADFLYYVDEGLYDNQGFYRVVHPDNDPKEMGMSLIQGGRLDLEKLTQSIDHETTEKSGLSNIAGSVAIARDAPGTGSAAYFFINAEDNTFLDFGGERNPDGQGYAVFGKVTKGLDVVRVIQQGETNNDDDPVTPNQFLKQPVIIKKAYRK